jgi:hypothetical protein
VRTLDLSRGDDPQLVVYFYATGTRLGPDFLKLQLLASLERIFDPDVPSALVRLSIQVRRPVTREAALEAARDLARELVPEVRKRLTGGRVPSAEGGRGGARSPSIGGVSGGRKPPLEEVR